MVNLYPNYDSDLKSLKIPKGISESVNRIRTDNTMTIGKGTKGQTTLSKTKIEYHELH
jgi:hypothetical protein